MDLSVIIPAHNEERLLPEQLEALLAQDWDRSWEILVVDNQSTDRTAQVVTDFAARDPRVRLVPATGRIGPSHARNVGVSAACGTAVAFCDADDVVGEGWVAAIGEAVLGTGFVTGLSALDRLNPAGIAGSRGRGDEERLPTFHGIFPFAHGNNFAIRRELYLEVGGSDEALRAAEDAELSLRVWLHGVALQLAPDAVVSYRYRTKPSELFRQGRAYGTSRPLVARRLFEATGRRPPRLAGWRSWLWLLVNLPALATRAGRARWAWVAGNRWGQVVGSIRERHLLL